MYYPYFIAYMAAGLIISIVVFLWALRNGQFRDQQRARFLPLEEELQAPQVRASRLNRMEAYLVIGVVLSGLLASAVFLIFLLLKSSPASG